MTGTLALAPSRRAADAADPATEAAAGRCLDWLMRIDPALLGDAPCCGVEAAALAGLATQLAPSRWPDAMAICEGIADRLPVDVWAQCDLLPALLAAKVTVDCGSSSAGAQGYLQALSELDHSEAAGSSQALLALAFGRSVEASTQVIPAPRLDREHPETTAAILGTIERATGLGTRTAPAEPAVPILLDGAAMACLRRYDLLAGLRFLRAAAYLRGDRSLAAESGLRFVRALQREDGGFGDFASETPRSGAPEAVTRCRLDLAVAFGALWTLAELGQPGFRPIANLLRAGDRQWSGRC